MARPGSASDPLWYKDAIIYELHVRSFFDSNVDGVGDFAGLARKLDYLQELGVTCLWLLPFYPSPLRDDGYDIARYDDVHPAYGTMRDCRRFLREAHARGLQIIVELVINHTSDQHPWFLRARRAPAGSVHRNFYVWSDTTERYQRARIVFSDTERSNWTWDAEAGAYYWHRFFHHQPDLNFDNPAVMRAVLRVMRFWLDLGVDGLRLDAVPYLIERDGSTCENLPETHDVLRAIRRALDAGHDNRMLLAEANLWPPDMREYFGDGDECHMAFNFPLMPRIYMALKQEDRHPIVEIWRQTPEIPESCQWALFLRNHDELTLEAVSEEERDYMYGAYAADPQMRLNAGIRRRLAPLMENNRRRIELLNSFLFSFPGTPIVYYGDEIGMGDNIYLGDRNGVRTPMQWTGDRNAGFSQAEPARLFAPPIMDPVYGYQAVNVEAQQRSPASLLNWMKRLIALRRQHRTLSRGSLEFLTPANRAVLAYLRRDDSSIVLCVANLSRTVQAAELNLTAFAGLTPVEMFDRAQLPRIGEQPYMMTLGPYGFYWFSLEQAPAALTIQPTPVGVDTVEASAPLLAGARWEHMLDGPIRSLVERELLPAFLARQAWSRPALPVGRARFVDWGLVRSGPEPWFLTFVSVEQGDRPPVRIFLPVALREGAPGAQLLERQPAAVLARIAGARTGVLADAFADRALIEPCLALLQAPVQTRLRSGASLSVWHAPGAALDDGPGPAHEVTRRVAEDGRETIALGGRWLLWIHHRVDAAASEQLALLRHLSERIGHRRTPRVARWLTAEDGAILATLAEVPRSQSTLWDYTVGEVKRFFDRAESCRAAPPDLPVPLRLSSLPAELADEVRDTLGGFTAMAATLGARLAELHRALAAASHEPDTVPEPLDDQTIAAWQAHMAADVEQTRVELASSADSVPTDSREAVAAIVAEPRALAAPFAELAPPGRWGTRIRVHGDCHLGHVLWAESDVVFTDLLGRPIPPLATAPTHSPLFDVATLITSFGYATGAVWRDRVQGQPELRERLRPWARFWVLSSVTAMVSAYRDELRGDALAPDGADFERLLRALLLHSACMELRRELSRRPEWVASTVSLVLSLAGLRPPVAVPPADA